MCLTPQNFRLHHFWLSLSTNILHSTKPQELSLHHNNFQNYFELCPYDYEFAFPFFIDDDEEHPEE